MTDEPLPTSERTDAEPKPTRRDASDRDEASSGDGSDRDASDRGVREGPDRATDPPPDRPGADGEPDRETDADEPLEHRLERLRLWRTVVTLAVVVARLVRSL
jgi:hypothetical protein